MFKDIQNIVLSVVLALVIGQTIKVFYETFKHKRYESRYWVLLGGMPSTHTSSVAALTTSIFFEEGFSLLFFVVLVFSIIVARDAFGIRLETEKACKEINRFLKKKVLNEDLGHTFLEVIVGAILGIVVSLVVYFVI